MMTKLLLLLAISFPFFQPEPPKPPVKELIVYAAGNLKDPLTSISHFYERSNPEWKVKYKFGPSDELIQLVDGRLPVDVFIFADRENADSLHQQQLIAEKPIEPFLSDRVVIVIQGESDYTVKEVKELVTGEETKKFALSGDKTPMGASAREFLKKLGLQELPADKLVNVKNPHAALNAVKNGEAKWTFCYGTDAAGAAKKLKVLFSLSPSDMPPIDYYAVVLKASKNQAAAERFLEAVQSTISRKLFENDGYILLMPPPAPPVQTAPKEKKRDKD